MIPCTPRVNRPTITLYDPFWIENVPNIKYGAILNGKLIFFSAYAFNK